MCQLPCTLRKVVLAITVMGMVKLLAEIVGEWVVLVMEYFMHKVYGVVVREKSNAESVVVPVKENDIIMKGNNANNATIKDLRRMIIVSGIVVFGLVGCMFFSPLSSQFTEDGAGRGESWETEISEYISTKNYPQALHVVDSIIKSKQEGLPRFPYLDRFLEEEKRVDVGNARADIYELQWLRIGILKEMGNRASLVEALKDYCTVIGYNQEKAKTMLDSLESE